MSMYLKRAEDSGNSKQRPEWNDLWICVLQRCVRARTQRECRLYAYLYTYLCIYVCFDKKLRKPNHAYFGFTHIFAYFTHNQFACNARTYVYTFICKCVCEKWLVTYNLITKFQKSEWHNYSQNHAFFIQSTYIIYLCSRVGNLSILERIPARVLSTQKICSVCLWKYVYIIHATFI